MHPTKLVGAAALAASILLAPASGVAYTGHVIDAVTGKPAAGIFVIGRWETGGGLVVPSSGCVVAITQADEKGEFTLRGGDGFFGKLFGPSNRPAIELYQRGYQRRFPSPGDEEPIVAIHDTRTKKDRLAFLRHLEDLTECGDLQQRKAKLLPLYQAILAEMQSLATESDELPFLNGAMFAIDLLNLGPATAEERSRERWRSWGLK